MVLYRLLMRWALNGVVVTTVFILVAEVLRPAIFGANARSWSGPLSWAIACILSGPFLWAMWFVLQKFSFTSEEGQVENRPRGGTLFLGRLLTILWVSILSLEFFPIKSIALATIAFIFVLLVTFYRRLESSYRWFEAQFLSTFEGVEKTKRPIDPFRHLVPWDAHLVRIKVHPNSDIAGKRLEEAKLRKAHGVNVVVIQRGQKAIVAPKPETQIFPKDELLVLGTDEQIESVRSRIENPPGLARRFHHPISGYELRTVLVDASSGLAEKTIRDSNVRGLYGGMIVGVTRGEKRIINPDSDLKLLEGDLLWIVGETDQLNRLVGTLSPT